MLERDVEQALVRKPEEIDWDEAAEEAALAEAAKNKEAEDRPGATKH